MNKRGILTRVTAGALGGVLLIGGAGAAFAAPGQEDDHDVDVNVNITAVEPVGALTLTVAGNSTSLTETTDPADTLYRVFTGTLPSVTVTDDREELPDRSYWYVTGQSSDFISGANVIGAENFGWTPALTAGDDGAVSVDEGTVPVLDPSTTPETAPNNVGLESAELFALAADATVAQASGAWSANAALKLKTLANVTPGAYAATITLTLWSDIAPADPTP